MRSTTHQRGVAALVALLLPLSSCVANTTIEGEPQILCSDDSECPNGFACASTLGSCVRSGVAGEAPNIADAVLVPAAARGGDVVILSFNTTTPLARTPTVVLGNDARSPWAAAEPADGYAYGFSLVATGLGEGTWPILATLIDRRGNLAEDVSVTDLRVDDSPPQLAGSILVTTPTVGKGGTAAWRVVVSEPLVRPPTVTLVWGLATAPVTDITAVDDVTFDCTFAATGTEPATSAGISVEMEDLAGNVGSGLESSRILFDPVAPQPLIGMARRRLLPATGSALAEVFRAGVGTRVELFVVFDELNVDRPDTDPLGAQAFPYVRGATGTGNVVDFAPTLAAGATFVFEYLVDAASPEGLYEIEVGTRDAVGNEDFTRLADLISGSVAFADRFDFEIDTTVPPAPNTIGFDQVRLERNPWGSSATGGAAALSVSASPGASEGCAPADPGCGWIIAWDGLDTATRSELGRAEAVPDGSFTIALSRADAIDVYLEAIDAAANRQLSVPAPILHGEWVATFNRKQVGSLVSNPHRIDETPASALAPGALAPRAVEAATYAGMGLDDGTSAILEPFAGWAPQLFGTVKPEMVAYPGWTFDSYRGRFVYFGGHHNFSASSDTAFNDTWIYTTEGGWEDLGIGGMLPTERFQHALVYDARRDRVVLFGGRPFNDAGISVAFDDLWEFDGDTWKERCDGVPASDVCPLRPGPRYAFAYAGGIDRSELVIFGGRELSSATYFADLWRWDGNGWTELSFAGGPEARGDAAMAYDSSRGRFVLYGGQQGGTRYRDIWLLDSAGWQRIDDPGTPTGPQYSGYAMAYDERRDAMLLFGDDEFYQLAGNAWQAIDLTGNALTSATQHAFAYDPVREQVTMFGGGHSVTSPFYESDEIWAWDGQTWERWPDTDAGPSSGTLTYHEALGLVVLAGGPSGQTWTHDGEGWTQLAAGPQIAGGTPVAYDVEREVVILYGGAQDAETWAFGAHASCGGAPPCWELWLGTTAGPGTRTWPAVSYDRRRKRTVLFAGLDPAITPTSDSMLADTWELGDWGSLCAASPCWRQVATTGPSKRWKATMRYDPLRGRTILFGGSRSAQSSGGGNESDETWSWDGSVWALIPVTAPPEERSNHAMHFDAQLGQIWMYAGWQKGGFSIANRALGDAWVFDGLDWLPAPTDRYADRAAPGSEANLGRLGRRLISVDDGVTWLRDDRAQAVVHWSWQRAEVPLDDIIDARLRVVASTDGDSPTLIPQPIGVAEVAAWQTITGRWKSFTPIAAGGNEISVDIDGATLQRAIDSDGDLIVRLRGVAPAHALAIDYLELSVRYRLGFSAACGDGVVTAPAEHCDDGNVIDDGNGCDADCRRIGTCGDGVLQSLFEECDNGSANSDSVADACRTSCDAPRCGDGVVDSGEACDDGNRADDGNGCDADCILYTICGDGVRTGAEDCDAGSASVAGCDASCALDLCCTTQAAGVCSAAASALAACVCITSASCCSGAWDASCVDAVEQLGCGVCSWPTPP